MPASRFRAPDTTPANHPESSASQAPVHAQPLHGGGRRIFDPLIELIVRRRFAVQKDFERLSLGFGGSITGGAEAGRDRELVDVLLLNEKDPHLPEDTFDRLRWGGQIVLVSRDRKAIEGAVRCYETWRRQESPDAAWEVEVPLGAERRYGMGLLGWFTSVYFMTARKVMLVPPGKSSDRFTYHVRLDRPVAGGSGGAYEVVKQVPSEARVLARLTEKFPEADGETLKRRARKFTEKIFPVFLTRETAILKLLQRDMPAKFRDRVPRLISAETDRAGFTRSMRMTWLRNARPIAKGWKGHGMPLSQLEFARQAAELLAALHDEVGVMHLDLRLDNVVITEQGVGFVDFGSAVRVGEEFPEASLLSNLFDEMMRTSQIQRMLGKMTETGMLTSEQITSSHQRIDKAVDFFYLALQINNPLSNPDFRGLVEFDPASRQAGALAELTEKILRPEDPHAPGFTSARDILLGVEEIAARLGE
jgi:hypothetical protein